MALRSSGTDAQFLRNMHSPPLHIIEESYLQTFSHSLICQGTRILPFTSAICQGTRILPFTFVKVLVFYRLLRIRRNTWRLPCIDIL